MEIKKLSCPVCGKPMVLVDRCDSIKELVCEECSVVKKFNSWEEQHKYEKLYANNKEIDNIICWQEEIANINQCPQRQDSLTDQLKDLILVSDKLGFYNASSYLKNMAIKMR